ncbi:MAG TPA: PAC2 family protein [Candidatus Thermoplasmatota archaeon]|nr:PAC2 family protein [Candidatus Thermoplasmatota archaeon]
MPPNSARPPATLPVAVREYKRPDLTGCTLVVSVPHVGMGNSVVTDFLLDSLRMDQIAVVDSEGFPPVALVHDGRPRFPLRIHASVDDRVAVARSEIPLPAAVCRAVAHALLDWSVDRRMRAIVAIDALAGHADPSADGGPPPLWFAARGSEARERAMSAGLQEVREGLLSGIPAVLLTESRFAGAEVVGLFAELREPLDDARSVPALTQAVSEILGGLPLDFARLEREVADVESRVRSLQESAQRELERLSAPALRDAMPMYG